MKLSGDEARIRIEATAATLDEVAEWGLRWFGGKDAGADLHDAARQVRDMRRNDMCCPICDEIACDEGCPLEGVRQ